LAKALNNLDHGLSIEHAGNVMGDGRHDLSTATRRQFSKKKIDQGAADICKSVTVEEQKQSAAMALPQELYRLV